MGSSTRAVLPAIAALLDDECPKMTEEAASSVAAMAVAPPMREQLAASVSVSALLSLACVTRVAREHGRAGLEDLEQKTKIQEAKQIFAVLSCMSKKETRSYKIEEEGET